MRLKLQLYTVACTLHIATTCLSIMNVLASPQGSLPHFGCVFFTSATARFSFLLQGALRESRQCRKRTDALVDDVRNAFVKRGHLGSQRPPALAGREVGDTDDTIDSSPSSDGRVSTAVSRPITHPRKGSGVGFGASPSSTKTTSLKASKDKASKEKKKAAVIRRAPPENPVASPPQDPRTQQIETAFIASWASLGALILVEGLVLAASGFLPEDWDDFLVKFLYPSFSPTVGLFLIGAAGYGLYRYLGIGNKTN